MPMQPDAPHRMGCLTIGRPLAYGAEMEFEWDDAKSSACFERRGFDFAYAVRAFLDPHRIVAQDRRRDYGEDRYWLLGVVDGRTYVAVYTSRFGCWHHFGPQGQPEGGRGL